ncbi:glycosyltransferase family 4 protein [Catellatospora chokoriensis]|uniref:Glycosyltransferase subfamily 4-like N-terminal domain-containing protein n=1 Tax=Catellatospora chokoriensis TaxID=310353 RepID=A0A8J3K4Q6_9ACTN|nr:glycosyltransferase family 4 protein [Catellatospora chokoriensis]GIF90243.1 hypothetical protein Cch02nite_36870 [Catellatospora chokoriensis]
MNTPHPIPRSPRRVLVLSRYDIGHPHAGDVEHYLHEITRRWAADGCEVTWSTTRTPGLSAEQTIAGVRILRSLSPLGALTRLVGEGARFDAILDGGDHGAVIPLVTGQSVPVVPVVHRIRRRPAGRLRRLITGPVSRWNRPDQAVVVLSPSARHDLRHRHRFGGPIFVVPPGTPPSAGSGVDPARSPAPTIVVDVDLVAEQRIDLLLKAVPQVASAVPGLRVEILGDGPELAALRDRAATSLATVTLHGRVTDAERDAWLRRAWLTVSTATGTACGCPLLAAAAYGVPGVALQAPGTRDFLRAGRTGHLVDSPDDLPAALIEQLTALADPATVRRAAQACRTWAGCFTWQRSAALLAGVVEHQIRAHHTGTARRRSARSDIATLVRLPAGAHVPVGALRPTDEVATTDGQVNVMLNGCDEHDALGVLARLGVTDAGHRLAGHDDLLIGPHPLPPLLAGPSARRTRPRPPIREQEPAAPSLPRDPSPIPANRRPLTFKRG